MSINKVLPQTSSEQTFVPWFWQFLSGIPACGTAKSKGVRSVFKVRVLLCHMASQKAVPFILEGIFIKTQWIEPQFQKLFLNCLYTLGINPFIRICDLQISFAGLPFLLVDSILDAHKFFILMKPIYLLLPEAFDVIVKSTKEDFCVLFYGCIHFIVLVSVIYCLSKVYIKPLQQSFTSFHVSMGQLGSISKLRPDRAEPGFWPSVCSVCSLFLRDALLKLERQVSSGKPSAKAVLLLMGC